ncbi:Ankyrin repeat-containing domain [Phytophthora cactorum]|nr:Ankyrin repeat-containing domain [Phytophthora cactorum]
METETQAAVKAGDVGKLQELLDNGVNLDVKDEDERTPLHWACATGRLDVAEFLLERGKAAVNVQDDAGWTPLMSAASAGHGDIVGLLLSEGADANLPNENGQIPLHYHRGRLDTELSKGARYNGLFADKTTRDRRLLLDYTRDVNEADNTGSTPLMRAIGGKPSPVIIALLIDHGAKVNTRDVGGNTPLHLAVSEGYEDIARFLLENGANPNVKNNDEERCIDLAKPAFRAEIQMLVAKKKGPNHP